MTPLQTYSTVFIETDRELSKDQLPIQIEQVSVKEEQITFKEEPITIKEEQITIKQEQITFKEEQITFKEEPITIKEEQITIKQEQMSVEYEVKIPVDNNYEEVVVKIEKLDQEPVEIDFAQDIKEKDNTEHTIVVPIEHIEIKLEKVKDSQKELEEKGTSKKSAASKKKQPKQDNCVEPSPFECKECHKVFKNIFSLRRHTPSHKEKKYSCEFCSKTYLRGNSLAIHIRRHTGETPFVCDYCNYNTHTRLSLISHIRLHTGEKPFSCNLCEESFRTRSSLHVHKKRTHGIIRNKTVFLKECHLCQKIIKSSCTYKKHMDKHLGIGPVCDICKKKFSAKGSLRIHMRKHMDIRKYPCTICDKNFFTKSHLKSHIRAHEDKKPYECNLCGFRFNQRYHLNAHILVHEKSGKYKRFKCDECEKKFMTKNYLMTHIACVHNDKVWTPKKQKKIY